MPGASDRQAPRQLLAFTFPPGTNFEGGLSGALQRIESGGALRVLDAVFVGRDDGSEELSAVSLASTSSAGMIGQLIGFRLDDAARARETQAALDGPAGELVRTLGGALEPGWAVAALVVEHAWAQVLDDAVARMGGSLLASQTGPADSVESAWAALPGALAARLGAAG
jgi:hypothetical protein